MAKCKALVVVMLDGEQVAVVDANRSAARLVSSRQINWHWTKGAALATNGVWLQHALETRVTHYHPKVIYTNLYFRGHDRYQAFVQAMAGALDSDEYQPEYDETVHWRPLAWHHGLIDGSNCVCGWQGVYATVKQVACPACRFPFYLE